jgi:hypothetical protein
LAPTFKGIRKRGTPRPPSAPLIESEALESHLRTIAADPETEAFGLALRERGYAVIDLGPEARALCDKAVAETEPYFQDGMTRVQDAWRRGPAVRALAGLPRLRAMLGAVYGREAFPFQTLNFRRGSQQNVHADTIHFHSEPAGFMCGVWIALEDIEPGCGPLTYYPGSHKLPVLTMRGAGVNRTDPDPDDYVRYYLPALAHRLESGRFTEQEAMMRKGQAFVWVANLSHGGAPIARPESTRRSLVVHFFFEDCVYHTPMLSDVEGARLHVRIASDVRTGGWVWPKRDGRPVPVSARTLVIALRDRLQRRVHRF